MPFINFKAHGIILWAEYTNRYEEPELLSLTLSYDEEHNNIEPLVSSDIIEMAYKAINQDILDLREYQKETTREMRQDGAELKADESHERYKCSRYYDFYGNQV